MSVMAAADIWPDQDRVLTVEDMENMPDDEFRYELDEGMLIVSPAPSPLHQRVVTRLSYILITVCPPALEVLVGPGININKFQHRVPDLAVVDSGPFGTSFLERPPALAVEVASPRTRLYDRSRKKDIYEAFGIAAYWIVVPDESKPELTAFELRGSRYVRAAGAVGSQRFEAVKPFPVSFAPSDLVSTRPPRP